MKDYIPPTNILATRLGFVSSTLQETHQYLKEKSWNDNNATFITCFKSSFFVKTDIDPSTISIIVMMSTKMLTLPLIITGDPTSDLHTWIK